MNWFKKLLIEKEEDRRNNGDNEGNDPFIIKVNDRRADDDQFFNIPEVNSSEKKSSELEFEEVASTSKDSVILGLTTEIKESEIAEVEISELENSTAADLTADFAADALAECDKNTVEKSILKLSESEDTETAVIEYENENEIPQAEELNDDENVTCENCCFSISSSSSSSFIEDRKIVLVDPDEFFDDPEDVRKFHQEASFLEQLSEWVIVEFPDTTAAVNENFFAADDIKESEFNSSSSCTIGTYSTLSSSINIDDNNDLYFYCDCAQHLDDHMAVIDSSWLKSLYKIFWNNKIRIGLAIVQPKEEIEELNDDDLDQKKKGKDHSKSLDFLSSDKLTYFPMNMNNSSVCENNNKLDSNCCENNSKASAEMSDYCVEKKKFAADAIARSLMGALKSYEMEISPVDLCCDRTNGSNHCEDNAEDHEIKDHFDIKKYFKLDDHGNILLDMNHIVEEKGYGFLMKRSKKLYRGIVHGKIIDENYTSKCPLIDSIKKFFHSLREYLIGHPRNKLPLGSPGESIRIYTLLLANDNTSTFSRNIENFIACTKESREAAPQVVMRNMRQFMNGMKNYLVKHGEGDFHQEVQKARSHLKSDEFLNLDAILESVMHQLVVLPLREHLYGMFVDYYTRSGDIQLLVENVKYACARGPIEFGIRASITPPVTSALHQISILLVKLQEAELPLDKLDLFLCVISSIFDATGCPRGQQLGADDFLPILVYVVAKCGFVGAEIEAEFMWGLLQPALLSGEAGYYLTALCSAVHVLKSFMSSENEGTGSLDWRSSTLPACSSVLRVIIPDECNGSLQTRTLPVRPHTTTKEVCRIIAHKARITNPQDYGLFKLVDGEETLLAEAECPQDARIAARGKHCMLAYKRIDAKIAWPTVSQLAYT